MTQLLRRIGCRLLGHHVRCSASTVSIFTKRTTGPAEALRELMTRWDPKDPHVAEVGAVLADPSYGLIVQMAGFSIEFPTQITWERHARTMPSLYCRRCGTLVVPGEDR